VRSVYVKGAGECLVARDVWRAVGYDRKAGVQAIQRLVPEKYKMRLGDVLDELDEVLNIEYLHLDTVLLKEPGLYSFLLRCKRPEAKPFMEWVCEEVLPREVRKLAAEVNAERHKVQEKDTQLALLNDDLTESQKLVKQFDKWATKLQYNNIGLQGEIRAKDQEIARLSMRFVPNAMDPGKDNVIMIVRKHTCQQDDSRFEYPYYCARIQRRAIPTKRRWILEQFPRSEEIVVIDNPNGVHAFNRFEEEEHVERYKCHFRLVDLTREDLYSLGVPAIDV